MLKHNLPFLLLLLWPIAATAPAGTYYLSPAGSDSSGTGTQRRPWKTITQAASKVPDDGSTIVLLDGLYEGGQSIGRQFAKTCTIRAENPYYARLRSSPNGNRVLSCYNAANVTIEGLEIFGSGGTQGEYVVHVGTAKTHHVAFENCIIHDSYNNDLVKINDAADHIAFRNCLVFNQPDQGGAQHFDINTVTDIEIDGCILFNDYAGSGRKSEHKSQGFIVVKNSGSTPDVTRRVALRRNIFLNYDGAPDQAFVLLGEDGKPFFEAQQVMIENNLFIHNSLVQSWGTLLYKGGLKDITFRANTVVGHPAVKWTGAESAVCIRIDKNPPMGDLTFSNNIWCDATGRMPRFSISSAKTFAPDAKLVLNNNLYWNAASNAKEGTVPEQHERGQSPFSLPIPTEPQDVLVPERDAKKLVADPGLGWADENALKTGTGTATANGSHRASVQTVAEPVPVFTLPRWDPAKGQFISGEKTIRAEFERLVKLYGAIGPKSPAIGAGDPANMPADDILGNPRGPRPAIGCYEPPADKAGR